MNKKLFLGMFAAAGMLLATSCSNDELDMVQSGNEAQVTFSLAAEGGIATRAISDGTGANVLYYAIFDADGKLITTINGSTNGLLKKEDAFPNGSKEDNVEVTLAKGQEYTAVFWAQDEDCKAYTVSAETDGLKVAVDYKDDKNDNNNDETRDAFFKAEPFTVTGDTEIPVVLKRPFAQINVGVTEADWNAAVESGVEITESKVVIKNVATSINLLDGTVSGEEEVTYDFATIPAKFTPVETLEVDVNRDGAIQEEEKYVYLSMSYILTDNDAERTTLEADGLQFTFSPENGEDIVFDEGLHAVPVQRNWRTNILGKILTGDVQFNITIDPAYEGDYNYPEASGPAKELIMKATFGGIYTQTEDFNLEGDALEIKADFTYNIEDNKTLTSGSAANYGIIVQNGTTTINGNGNIKSEGGGIGIVGGATLIFNGGNLDVNSKSTSGRYLFYLEGAGSKATINGGNFDFNKTQNQKRAYIYADEGTTVYVNGGTFGEASARSGYTAGILTNGTGKVIITGGTFGFDPTTWVADDYKAVKSGDKWYVVKDDVTVVSNATDFQTALSSGGNIVLVGDVSYNKIDLTTQTQDVYIDAQGHKITTTDSYGVQVNAGKNITLKNAEVVITKEGDYLTYAAGFKVENGDYNGKTITLDNCTIKMANADWAYAVNMPASVKNLNLVIDKCTLEGAIALQCWGDNNTITVTNSDLICNYTTNAMYTSYCVALQGDDTNKAENNKLDISGCTFSYSGIDNFNSEIGSVVDRSGENTNNTINVSDCTYNNGVKAY